jgi:hypothetical protein
MALETIEAGDRALRGADLGVEKACVAAALNPEHTPLYLASQARKLATRFGLTPASARAVAALALEVRGR